MDEAKALYQQLDQDDIALLEDSSESLGSRFVLTTIRAGQRGWGEFDEVIIWNATDEAYHTMKEQMMLYTTCTRAENTSLTITEQAKRAALSRIWKAPMKRIWQ